MPQQHPCPLSAGSAIEKGIDTQCLVLRYGKLAVVAFRGTQPVSFFGWCAASMPSSVMLT